MNGPRGLAERVRDRLIWARDIYEGVYFAPYRREIYREYLRHRDRFFLLTVSDLLGIPNPAQFYSLELLPEALDQFHQWHLRMGIELPPDGGFRCC